ncbi:MAG: RIP metalloprotease RseP [Flavobacteriales bacterium]|nr:RIP metalloprotease RseP [Flavobacteriales bacterium]
MEFFTKAVSLIFSLSILVVLHELGHYIPAKLFKTKVEKFYLFFDPWFSLVKKKVGDTVYGIGWLPLGGYVKIAGMVDESMDKEQMKKPPEPWEFRSKPAWQRLIIMIGGVTVNIILAFVIYSMMLFTWGKDVLPASSVAENGVMVSDVMKKYGFKDGDKLISIDGKQPYLFSDYQNGILLDNAETVKVNRNGEDTIISIPSQLPKDVIASKTRMFSPLVEFIAEKFTENSLNKTCGIKKGDRIIAINGKSVPYFQFFAKELAKDSCREVGLTVMRNGDSLVVNVKVDQYGKIGLYNTQFDSLMVMDKKVYSFFESIPAGFIEMTGNLSNYVKQLKYMFTSEGIKQVGGFGSIGNLFPESFTDDDYWQKFWNITALLSVVLAIMNLLPIPALDGGHVLFLFYEIIFRRKPGDKFLEYAQITGMVLLLSLMVYANGKDVVNGLSSDEKEVKSGCWEEIDSSD